ncbi:MAG: DUF6351 family protein [Pseudohongiellaceae bacterium]
MPKSLLNYSLLCAGFFLSLFSHAQVQSSSCEALVSLELADGSISSAEYVDAGSFNAPSARDADIYAALPAFCRISAVLSPVEGSNIQIEVWLPAQGWNSKLVAVGNGGLAGSIRYNALAGAVAEGFAGVSTNTGHDGQDPGFLMDSVLLTDFAYRAIHEMTVTAKTLVTNYYSTNPRFIYFNGCSTGGRQALTAAQRYPDDFDGIVAGAPANSTVRMTMQQLWNSRLLNDKPGLDLSSEDFVKLNEYVMTSCDGLDGLEDGLIENPAMCLADPGSVPDFSQEQIEAIRLIYKGAVNPVSGELIFPGFAKGSELLWTAMVSREPFSYSNDVQAIVVNQDPEWNFMSMDYSRDLSIIDNRVNLLGMQAINPDISEFINNGGKLLLYHGWNDHLISPFNTINYYNEVLSTIGSDAQESISLFMMPGVNHCAGGAGFDTWSKLGTIDDWRESGRRPERINATHIEDGIETTRPLCVYPQSAVYTSRGEASDAASFECQ